MLRLASRHCLLVASKTHRLAASLLHKPLHLILLSAALAERGSNAKLWIMDEYRKMRGAGESAALAFEADRGRDTVQVAIARCGKIIPPDISWMEWIKNSLMQLIVGLSILPVDDLNKSLLKIALEGR